MCDTYLMFNKCLPPDTAHQTFGMFCNRHAPQPIRRSVLFVRIWLGGFALHRWRIHTVIPPVAGCQQLLSILGRASTDRSPPLTPLAYRLAEHSKSLMLFHIYILVIYSRRSYPERLAVINLKMAKWESHITVVVSTFKTEMYNPVLLSWWSMALAMPGLWVRFPWGTIMESMKMYALRVNCSGLECLLND